MHFFLVAYFIFLIFPCYSECQCNLLTIEDAEIIAINNNPRLKQSKFQSDSSYWLYQERLGRLLPQVFWNKQFGRSNSLPRESFFQGRYVSYQTETLRFDQFLLSLPTYYDTRSFKWLFSAAFFNYLEELVQTLANIRITHYNVIAARQRISVYQHILDLYKESYENEDIKLSVGESTKFENIRNRLAYTNTLTDYYRAVSDAEKAKDAWISVLGIDPGEAIVYEIAEKDIPLEDIPFIKELLTRVEGAQGQIKGEIFTENELCYWRTLASFYRPVVKRFQAEYRSANMQVKGAWGTYIPEISAFSKHTINKPPQYFGTREKFNDYGIAINWPIFDGFSRESRVYKTWADRSAAKYAVYESWNNVQLEIYDRSFDLEQAVYNLKSSTEGEHLSNEGINQAKELLALGDLTLFEYRDMIQSLGRAELDLTQAKFNLIANYYALLAAMGLQNQETGIFLLRKGCGNNE